MYHSSILTSVQDLVKSYLGKVEHRYVERLIWFEQSSHLVVSNTDVNNQPVLKMTNETNWNSNKWNPGLEESQTGVPGLFWTSLLRR